MSFSYIFNPQISKHCQIEIPYKDIFELKISIFRYLRTFFQKIKKKLTPVKSQPSNSRFLVRRYIHRTTEKEDQINDFLHDVNSKKHK